MSLFMPRSTSMASSTSFAAGAARSEHGKEFRRVAAQRGVAFADAVQEIEVLGLRKLLRFGDALGEGIQDMTASMAANGSRPACLASISAWPMRPNSRTLALIALPDAWNCC
uniref:hypothetical protein n=1 Tax=Enterobacter cloacae complex sp. TaxID=2027919 RepID=UPI003B671D1E